MSSKTQIIFRNYRPGDEVKLVEILNNAYREIPDFHEVSLEEFIEWYIKWPYFQSENFRIIECNGEIIGFAILDTRRLKNEGVIEIWRFAIRKEYQGKGFGSKLLQHIIDYCKKYNAKFLDVWCDSRAIKCIRFLEKHGFRTYTSYIEMRHNLTSIPEKPNIDNLVIREFIEKMDEDLLIHLHNTCFKDHYGFIPMNHKEIEYIERSSEWKNVYIYFAIYNGKPIGYIWLWYHDERNALSISEVGIVPEFRRRGFGKYLMIFALEKAKEMKCDYAFLVVHEDNKVAYNLYRKLGFYNYRRNICFRYVLR